MSHLTDEQLADYLAEPHPGDAESHLASCQACGDRLRREAELELELVAVAKSYLECGRAVEEVCDHCGACRRLAGYELEQVRVQHARGRLYLARDRRGVRVAIKELVFARAPGLEAVEAFEREAKFLRTLDHPAIPAFVASFTTGEGVHTRMYLVQEFVAGESLADRLSHHHFTEAELVRIAREVLEILIYLQRLTPPVFHRDIKPANLLVRPSGAIALVDFGAARDLGPTVGATLVGTFGYMPVEQLVGIVDATSDLYALGMSLLHLATRVEPWALDIRKTSLSRHFRAFLERLVAKEAGKRFPTAVAARAALDAPPVSRKRAAGWLVVAAVGGGSLAYGVGRIAGVGDKPELETPQPPNTPQPVTTAKAVPMGSPNISSVGGVDSVRPKPKPEPLTADELAGLEADIERLHQADPQPELVRRVRVKLDTTDGWRALDGAESTISSTRSPAFVPMMLKHACTAQHVRGDTLGGLFTALTGQALGGERGELDAKTAAALVRDWWPEVRKAPITDPCKMGVEARRMVERALAHRHWGGLGSALGRRRTAMGDPIVDVPIGPGCKEMVPELLSMVDTAVLRYGIAGMLTTLRKRGLADSLDATVRDRRATPAQRTVAMVAIVESGGSVPGDDILAVYASTMDPPLREALLRVMGSSDARVVPTLLANIDSSDDALRRAALPRTSGPDAVPALRRALLRTASANGMRNVTQQLARIGTAEALDALAAKLDELAAMKPLLAFHDWGNTLTDFETAVRGRVTVDTRHPACREERDRGKRLVDDPPAKGGCPSRSSPAEMARIAKLLTAAWRARGQ